MQGVAIATAKQSLPEDLLDDACIPLLSRAKRTVPGSIWRSPAITIYVPTCPLVPFTSQPKCSIFRLLPHPKHLCVTVVTDACVHRGLRPFDQDLARGSGQLIRNGHVV